MKKVGFLIFCLFAMCSMAGKAQDVVADSTGYIVKVGEMAPDFTVKLTDGKSITLSGLRGKVVMLQFTASWCGVIPLLPPVQNCGIRSDSVSPVIHRFR